MKFLLVDEVFERASDRIVTLKHVSLAEEYLADHFPGFPVLPGVLMVEAMAQAARLMLADRHPRLVLGEVRAVKFGSFVRPGETLRIEVVLRAQPAGDEYSCQGRGVVLRHAASPPGEMNRMRAPLAAGATAAAPVSAATATASALAAPPTVASETAVSGRFTMRPIRQ
jgi:hypothetical protein